MARANGTTLGVPIPEDGERMSPLRIRAADWRPRSMRGIYTRPDHPPARVDDPAFQNRGCHVFEGGLSAFGSERRKRPCEGVST